MVQPNVTPNSPIEDHPIIGLIGMGAMGRMYAKYLSEAGWERYAVRRAYVSYAPTETINCFDRIHVCDLPQKYEELQRAYEGAEMCAACPY